MYYVYRIDPDRLTLTGRGWTAIEIFVGKSTTTFCTDSTNTTETRSYRCPRFGRNCWTSSSGCDDLTEGYSRTTGRRRWIYDNRNSLSLLNRTDTASGSLQWKAPRDYRSFIYSQSGFKPDKWIYISICKARR